METDVPPSDPTPRPVLATALRLIAPALVLALVAFNLWLFLPLFVARDGRAGSPAAPGPGAPFPQGQGGRPPGPPQGEGAPAPPSRPPAPSPAPGDRGPRVAASGAPAPPPPPPSSPPPNAPGPASEPPRAGVGPIETLLGVVLLSSTPAEALDDTQLGRLRAMGEEVRPQLEEAYDAVAAAPRCLRADQVAYVLAHRFGGAAEDRQTTVQRVKTLLSERARDTAAARTEASASLGTAAASGPSLPLDDVVLAPLLLQDAKGLALDPAQAAVFLKAIESVEKVEALQSKLMSDVSALLRPQQLKWLEGARAELEAARRLAPLWALEASLEKP